jgi:ribonuclease VapC
MIIDASAIIAIAFREDDASRLTRAIVGSDPRLIAMPTVLETTLVIGGQRGARGRTLLRGLLSDLGLTSVPFKAEHSGR